MSTVAQTPVQGVQSTLSEWAGPYVTDMLGQAWAESNRPYEAYTGPLTAGPTGNQNAAFAGIAGLTVPNEVSGAATGISDYADVIGGMGYNGAGYTSGYESPLQTWNADQANTYMNPYLQEALDPAMAEARRQAEITRVNDAGRLTEAGAYGGSRQAIMEAEGNRNLMTKQNEMLTSGYRDAYDTALGAFGQDQNRALQDANYDAQYGFNADKLNQNDDQFGAEFGLTAAKTAADLEGKAGDYGLKNLASQMDIYDQQLAAGANERNIEQEGMSADYAQWQQERDHRKNQLQFQQSMLDGMPIAARDTQYGDMSFLQNLLSSGGGLADLFLKAFGDD